MSFILEISFGKSSSQNYKSALQYAKKFSEFSPISDTSEINTILIKADELKKKFRTIENLWFLISSWKSSSFLANGKPVEFRELERVKRIINCMTGYSNSLSPEDYCNIDGHKEGWGCKHLTSISRYIENSYYYNNYKYWFQFGTFINPTTWKIDKNKLFDALQREAEYNDLNLCEHFDISNIEKIISGFPGEINLENSDDWSILYEEYTDGITIEKKPVSIKRKTDNENDSTYLENDSDDNEQETVRNIPSVSFSDIGGINEIIEVIREVIEIPLKNPDLFKYLGIKPHKGILLFGPPGCGKTLIAKAIANDIQAHFISVKGPELLSKWYGESEGNLRTLFDNARTYQPSIIYFDEIDSIASVRSDAETLRHDSKIVNQLLTLLDGVESYENVCVIASTNRKELLDPAILRPGRFDYSIEVKKPTKEGCRKIFSIHTNPMPLSSDIDIDKFSERLYGLSGAEVAFVAREGAYNCLRRNLNLKEVIENDEVSNIDYEKFKIILTDFELALTKIR